MISEAIGKSTIEKQFIDYYEKDHPDLSVSGTINGYNRLKAYIIGEYNAGVGSTKIIQDLYKLFDIKVTTKTLIAWLEARGVTIRPPTRERERIAKTTWEKKLWNRIEKLKSQVKSMEKQRQIELKAEGELITLLRSQIADLAKENIKLRADVGRLMRVTETLKSTKTGDKNKKQSR